MKYLTRCFLPLSSLQMRPRSYILKILVCIAILCLLRLQYSLLIRKESLIKQVWLLKSDPNRANHETNTKTGGAIKTNMSWDVIRNVQHDDIHVSSKDDDVYPSLDDCIKIIEQDWGKNNWTLKAIPDRTSDEQVMKILERGCDEFKARYQFINAKEEERFSTVEELNFPIAYTLLVHKNLHQIATLLSAIYRSQHIYCIHADVKSKNIFHEGINNMSRCFPNVFRSSKSEAVIYASFSRLNAEVHCMKDLLRIPNNLYDWKYLINLCGQDFPTATNREIVNQLTSMNGRICISGTNELNDIAVNRVKYIHVIEKITKENETTSVVRQTWKLLDPPPYNLKIAKNMAYAIFTREFLQWALIDSEKGRALYNWSTFTKTPDEHFWATLHIYPKSPGWSATLNWRGIARAMIWKGTPAEQHCTRYWQHNSCVFGGRAMRWLTQARGLFINKFDLTYDSLPMRCLRKLMDERTRGYATEKNPAWKPMTT